jgi:AcrR family transcriptional regulator
MIEDAGGDPPSRRERARAATIAEIKQTALGLMRDQATADVRFADIARAMGLTAPALYRYFADRDELLTAMIVDAYEELAAALREATADVAPHDLWQRLMATAQAYRRWAGRDPAQFALIFGMPVPGYAAAAEGPTEAAAKSAMANLEVIVLAALERSDAGPLPVVDVDAGLARELETEHGITAAHMSHAAYQAMLLCWASLHGFACLEAYGQFSWLTQESRDALFTAHVRMAAVALGVPGPV